MISIDKASSIRLDVITKDDFFLLLQCRNNPNIFKWCRQNDLIDINSHTAWFNKLGLDPKIKMYAIRHLSNSDVPIFVGVCGLTDIDLINQRAEFSLYIDEYYQRSHYGTLALRLLIKHAFDSYPLNIIYGETFDGNPALKMFEKLGFQKEGTRREFYFREGKHIDAHLVSIKRGELK